MVFNFVDGGGGTNVGGPKKEMVKVNGKILELSGAAQGGEQTTLQATLKLQQLEAGFLDLQQVVNTSLEEMRNFLQSSTLKLTEELRRASDAVAASGQLAAAAAVAAAQTRGGAQPPEQSAGCPRPEHLPHTPLGRAGPSSGANGPLPASGSD